MKSFGLNLFSFVLAGTLLAGTGLAQSSLSPLSGTMNASLTLQKSCLVSGSNITAGVDFGTLDFGSRSSVFTGQIATQISGGAGGSGSTQLICSPDVSGITITIDGGAHAGQGTSVGTGTRAVANGSAYVPYEIYSDAAHTQVYTAGIASPIAVPVAGSAFNLPIYGLVNKTSADSLPTGLYTDTLNVTVAW